MIHVRTCVSTIVVALLCAGLTDCASFLGGGSHETARFVQPEWVTSLYHG